VNISAYFFSRNSKRVSMQEYEVISCFVWPADARGTSPVECLIGVPTGSEDVTKFRPI
jgi:hypothetical protein